MEQHGFEDRPQPTEPGWEQLDHAVSELEGPFPWANAYWKQVINRGTMLLTTEIERYLSGHAAFEAWCRANGRS